MPDRRAVRFKQADLARALRAAGEAGLSVARSEIDAEGKIVIVYGEPVAAQAPVVDELEEWRRKRRAG